jgi:putative ABC transport system permease protein
MLEPELRPWRLAATLFLILGLLGLAAAATGIYGLVAFDVTQRSRELGVRIALGATSGSILRLVLGSGLRVVLLGTAAGALTALVAGRVMSSLLYATSPYDPAVLLTTALTLTVAATLASLIPAWRAIRVDPVSVLSSE